MNITYENLVHIIDFLTIFEVSQACLLVFILIALRRNKRANIFLALFIVILSLNFFSMFLHANRYKSIARILMLVALPGLSIIGVLIYFYTSLMTGFIEEFKSKHLYHFAIFLVLFLVLLINWLLIITHHRIPRYTIFIFLIGTGLINSLVYVIVSFINLRKYYLKINNYFSDVQKYNLSWLTTLTYFSLLFFIIWNVDFWLTRFSVIDRNPGWIFVNICILTAIIYISAYYIINKPDTFSETKEMFHELDEEENIKKEKYAKQSIVGVVKESNLNMLMKYMKKNKPYLNENLTIKDLADEVGIPTHHLSIIINNMLEMNFYTFINEYRIKEAVRILEDAANNKANILSIAYNCGFNSKSTFNSVFKKITGKTPSEYRNSLNDTVNLTP